MVPARPIVSDATRHQIAILAPTWYTAAQCQPLANYPVHFYCQTRRSREFLRHAAAKSQLNLASQLAAVGQALKDEELVDMAHGVLRYLFGANPSHVSMMRYLGERFPVNAQLPDVPGMMVGWMGMTSDGLLIFDPHGAGRLDGPDRFMVREGNTATCAYLLDACSYLK